MNASASPLFVKVNLIEGGIKSDQVCAHVDLMQIIALEECVESHEGKFHPALRLVLMGGYLVTAWDDERTGVEEVTKMKHQFLAQAMNPALVVPSRLPVVSR